MMYEPLPADAPLEQRDGRYREVLDAIRAMIEGEEDWIAAASTIVCELHHAFAHYDWTGFYRQISPGMLAVGPYQGGHGCLRIPYTDGVCGAAARENPLPLFPHLDCV
jgi:L-methionine (R)-S-oxide reductase